MAEIADITRDNFDTRVLGAEGPLVVYYYATWCRPCREMEEIVQAVADELADRLPVFRVNTEAEAEIIAQQKIRTIPAFQVFKGGEPVDLARGSFTKLNLLTRLGSVIMESEA